MNFDSKDLISWSCKYSLNQPGTLELNLANLDNQYDDLRDIDVLLSENLYTFRVKLDDVLADIFTGYPIRVSDKGKDKTIQITFADRSYWGSLSKFNSEFDPGHSVDTIVYYFAQRYLGFKESEIIFDNYPYWEPKYSIGLVRINDEPMFTKIRAILEAMGRALVLLPNGNLFLRTMFDTSLTPFIYDSEKDLIDFGYRLGDIFNFENTFELIGTEKLPWEIEISDSETVLSTVPFNIRYIIPLWVREQKKYISESFLIKYKGIDYNPYTDSEPSLLYGNLPQTPTIYSDGYKIKPFLLLEVPIHGFKSVITDWEIKYLELQSGGGVDKIEVWKTDNEIISKLLGFNDNMAYFLIDLSNVSSNKCFFQFILYGKAVNPSAQAKKYYSIYRNTFKYPVVEDIQIKSLTNYYARKSVYYKGDTLANITGQYKLKTFELDFVDSDTKADTILTELANQEIYKLKKFYIKTPLNPGIYLMDLIQVSINSLGKTISFWVEEIEHTKTYSTFTGSIFEESPLVVS